MSAKGPTMSSHTGGVMTWTSFLLGQVALWLGITQSAWALFHVTLDPGQYVSRWFLYCAVLAVLVPAAVAFALGRAAGGRRGLSTLNAAIWAIAIGLLLLSSVARP